MAKFAFVLLLCLVLKCVTSYYGQQPHPSRIVYRHHYVPYQPQVPFISPVRSGPASPRPLPSAPVHHYAAPVPYGPPQAPYHMGAARPVSFYAPPPMPYPPMPVPYAPAASHHHTMYRNSPMVPMPPPTSSRFPFKNMFGNPYGAYTQQAPKTSLISKIKPFIFGGANKPKAHPHDPYYPNFFPPHHFTPNRPFYNRPAAAHHPFPIHAHPHPPPPMNSIPSVIMPQKSCSCSLHVGQLTVYKHTDMRSSYSCQDLKDCNSFCTNLFSSEDLRAQTRADACLIIGKDTTVSWFRRDHVCEPHGTKNDTKLSVDLCCKNLQPC